MFDFTELLYYKSKIYILFDEVIKNEFMKLHYNDVLIKHYKVLLFVLLTPYSVPI